MRVGVVGGTSLGFTMILTLLPFTDPTWVLVLIVAHVVSGAVGYLIVTDRPILLRGLSAVAIALIVVLPFEFSGVWLLERWLSTGESSDILPGLAGLAWVAFGVLLMALTSVVFAHWSDATILDRKSAIVHDDLT